MLRGTEDQLLLNSAIGYVLSSANYRFLAGNHSHGALKIGYKIASVSLLPLSSMNTYFV